METKVIKTEKTTLRVKDFRIFEGDMKTNIVSSIEMAEIVNALFSPFMTDYYGCNIRINDGRVTTYNPAIAGSIPAGAIYVDIYFKDRNRGGDGLKNLTVRGQKNPNEKNSEDGDTNNMATRFFAVNSRNNTANNGRAYEVTPETYEVLEEFMFGRNVRWIDHTQELSAGMSIIGSKEEAVVCISGLSLDKILAKIYGTKTDEGEFEYATQPSTMIPFRNNEFIMQVTRLDLAAVRKLQRDLGMNNPSTPYFHSC